MSCSRSTHALQTWHLMLVSEPAMPSSGRKTFGMENRSCHGNSNVQ